MRFLIKKKELALDWEDEIIAGIGLTRDGKIVHPAKKPAKKREKTCQKIDGEKTGEKSRGKKTAS